MGENVSGSTFYVDFETIRKHGGDVYIWTLRDGLKPTKYGDFSTKIYRKVNCKLFRYKRLSWSFHKEPMGGGTGEVDNNPDKEWKYPTPNSISKNILKSVCSR